MVQRPTNRVLRDRRRVGWPVVRDRLMVMLAPGRRRTVALVLVAVGAAVGLAVAVTLRADLDAARILAAAVSAAVAVSALTSAVLAVLWRVRSSRSMPPVPWQNDGLLLRHGPEDAEPVPPEARQPVIDTAEHLIAVTTPLVVGQLAALVFGVAAAAASALLGEPWQATVFLLFLAAVQQSYAWRGVGSIGLAENARRTAEAAPILPVVPLMAGTRARPGGSALRLPGE